MEDFMKHIIAIVGMCGSGKSVACDLLEEKGYKKVYFGGVTLNELKKQHLEINPENEKRVRESLRKEFGMGAYAKLLLPEIKDLYEHDSVVLDGLYSWDELVILKEEFKENLTVISVITDKRLRYERLSKREVRPLTNIEAEKRDIAEIENLKKGGPIAFADFYLYNNKDLKSYEKRLEEILEVIK